MLPLNSNDPYIDDNGKRSRLGDVIGSGGGGGYTLPTASDNTKGGVKVGNTLEMSGEVMNVKNPLPAATIQDAGKVLSVNNEGNVVWSEVTAQVTFARADNPNPDSVINVEVKEVV